MAESTIVKHLRDGTVTYAVGANEYEFRFEQGNFQANIPGPSVALYLDRGEITDPPSIRYNEDQPMSGSFSVYFRDVSSADYATALDLITKSGQVGSSWGTSMGANGEVRTGTLTWGVKGAVHGDTGGDHGMSFPYAALSGSVADGNPNIINFNFTAYKVYPTVT